MRQRPSSLAIAAVGLTVFAGGPVLARPYSTTDPSLIDGIKGEVLEVSEKPR